MKKLLLLFILLLFITGAMSVGLHAQDNTDSAWVVNNYYKKEVTIPMRDGTNLFTAIYAPRDSSEKHPLLITRTPYSCAPYGETFSPNLWKRYWKNYMHEKYILVIQDVRGKWMSEGQFEDIRPFNPDKKGTQTDEASDTYDAIDWLVKNVPGNNGKVGVFGISYPGFYTTMAALCGHPALKAVSPQAPVTDWFHGDDFHHNGALFLMDCFNFYSSGFGYPRPAPYAVAPVAWPLVAGPDNYEAFLRVGPIKEFTRLTGDSLAFWNEIISHPDYDAWWKARDPRNFVSDLQPAVLVVGGLFDAEDCFGAWNLYKAIEKKNDPSHFNKIIMGPWYHGQWSSDDGTHLGNISFGSNTAEWYQQHVEIPFFNYFLKGEGGVSSMPEATIFFSGENQWKTFNTWPPANKKDQEIFLQPDGKLNWSKPQAHAGFTSYVSDPAHPVPYTQDIHSSRTRQYMTDDQRFASRRPDVISFETDPLSGDLTLGGPVTANLFASTSGTDADFVVKIIDVFPNDFTYPPSAAANSDAGTQYPMGGYQMLVRGDIIRGRYRKDFSVPQAFVPGKVEQVVFSLPDVAHTFKKGHRLMVQIQSSWFPLADRNPQRFVNIYQAGEKDFQKAEIRIYHDDKHPSGVTLSVIPSPQ